MEAYYEKIQDLETKFEQERKELNIFIHDKIINKLSNINEVHNVQVHCASQRQRLSDKTSNLKSKIRKHSEKILKERKRLYEVYKTQTALARNDTVIWKCIDADLEHKTNFVQVIENQIDFYKRTIEGIDKIGFAIKYLIEQQKYLSGF